MRNVTLLHNTHTPILPTWVRMTGRAGEQIRSVPMAPPTNQAEWGRVASSGEQRSNAPLRLCPLLVTSPQIFLDDFRNSYN